MKRKFYTLLSVLFFSYVSLYAQVNEENQFSTQNNFSPVKSSQTSQISIYPQPSNGPINITYNEAQNQNPRISVYDIIGNLVGVFETERLNANTYSLDLSSKKPGYYFVKIESDSGTVSRRITIKP